MGFLKPDLLYLLLLIPLLLLLYMLKLRRKTHVVSSCILWEQSIEDLKANTLFQRLRKNLLLPLQVVFLALIIFALARPFLPGKVSAAQNTVLVIDGSASMKSTDVNGNRFEAARAAAVEMVENLNGGDRMVIIEAVSSPRIISGITSDKPALKNALNKMQPADIPTNLADAVQLASSIVKDMRQSEIVVLSDGCGKAQKDFDRITTPVRFIGFGKKDAVNVGITSLEVMKVKQMKSQVFVALQNFSGIEKKPVLVELYHDNDLIDVQELSLSPHERRPVIFDDVKYNKGVIRAAIEVKDDLDVDNQAYYILDEPEALRVLYAGAGNLFLEEAIKTVSSKIQLFKEKSNKEYDLFIFDGIVPDKIPGNAILVNMKDNFPFGKMLSRKNNPAVTDWDRSHPVMRFVDLSNLRVDSVTNYNMPSWMKPVAESDMGVLIWSGAYYDQRIIVLPFEIRPDISNNFPMLTAFPIFISNAINWLTEPGSASHQLKSGEPIRISHRNISPDQTVSIRKPDGEESQIRMENAIYKDTDRAGIYEVIGKGVDEKYAVNLLDESESDIAYINKIEIGSYEITSSAPSAIGNREIWASLILAAIMLLAIEWWVYHRRVLV